MKGEDAGVLGVVVICPELRKVGGIGLCGQRFGHYEGEGSSY